MASFLVVRVENLPGADRQEMRKAIVDICHIVSVTFLTVGINPHTGTSYVTLGHKDALALAEFVDYMIFDSCILRAWTEAVRNDYVAPPWFEEKQLTDKTNSLLSSVKVMNLRGDRREIVSQIHFLADEALVRVIRIVFSPCNTVTFVTVEKQNAQKMNSMILDYFEHLITPRVLDVPSTFVAPEWFREEVSAMDEKDEEEEKDEEAEKDEEEEKDEQDEKKTKSAEMDTIDNFPTDECSMRTLALNMEKLTFLSFKGNWEIEDSKNLAFSIFSDVSIGPITHKAVA
jgi:hypothetical protein